MCMRRRSVSVLSGLLFVGAVAATASCLLEKNPPPPDVLQADDLGGAAGATLASGGIGGEDGVGGAGGTKCACPDKPNPCTDDVCMAGVCQHPYKSPGVGCSSAGMICDGMGSCVKCLDDTVPCSGNCPRCQGSNCRDGSDCASKSCIAGICRLQEGDPCNDNIQCETNYCLSGTCKKYGGTGVRAGAIGEPCDQKVTCVSGASCTGRLCLVDDYE